MEVIFFTALSMLHAIRTSHHQLKEGLAIGRATKIPEGAFHHIVFAGMGGSSIAASLLAEYVREEVSIDIIQDYEVPSGLLTEGTLFIAFSYSGNTEETIRAMQQVHLLQRIPIVVVAHGGEMEQIARECQLPFFQLPKTEHPRCGIGSGLGVLLGIMEQTGLIPNQESIVDNTILFMTNQMASLEEEAKAFAHRLEGRVPIFYASTQSQAQARLYKIHMNENAKVQSFYGAFPEVNHNEMVGYTKMLMRPVIIYLRSKYDIARIQERMDVMRTLLSEESGIPFEQLHIEGNSWLEEAMFTLVHAYFSSYYLAEHYGVDPKPLRLVDIFKERLKSGK